ncbi:MAG: D-alanine--D-alanine ligase [Lactobacillus sp.]|nr:D-alanine--D-alanine ligase [Lactobacillus sp.]
MTKKVMVVMGGFSSEREVSLVSGKGVADALKEAGYDVVAHDLTSIVTFFEQLISEKPDVVFNALHGTFGEDGTIQGFLDLMQIPYTHSGMRACAIGMDKPLTKKIAGSVGINVTPHQTVKAKDFYQIAKSLSTPYVVKPIDEGSSVGVYIVKDPQEAENIKYDNDDIMLMIEKFIEGKELTVMVLEDKSYVVTELRPTLEFYDYKAKYTTGVTEHIIPAEIPDDVAMTCKEYAIKIHKALGCNTVSRSDFRYNPEDGVVFLEINTHPGMTPLSLVPEQAAYAGITYPQLCSVLVENAVCRKI